MFLMAVALGMLCLAQYASRRAFKVSPIRTAQLMVAPSFGLEFIASIIFTHTYDTLPFFDNTSRFRAYICP